MSMGGVAVMGGVIPLVTNNGIHQPRKWAQITADQLISVADNENKAIALALYGKVLTILEGSFSEVTKALFESDVERLTLETFDAIARSADGSPWSIMFRERYTQESMILVIRRNLMTSHHISHVW